MMTSDLDREEHAATVGARGRAAAQPLERPERIALSVEEAARALGVSRRHFDRHIGPHLRLVPVGGRKLVPVRELDRFIVERAT